ncbi:MAG: hypothetical protein HOM55_09345 [Proteobacteria bacterium]|nr:hypothetical protein [Pseudomonadota bacterium]
MKIKLRLLWVLASLMVITLPVSVALGHHSVAAGFEMDNEISVTGKITRMDWINPHSRLYLEAQDENGETVLWLAWFDSSNNLYRRGWRADDLPVGETITVSGFPARDGSDEIYGGETMLSDGRVLFAGNRAEY